MHILGLSAFGRDSAAALVSDGTIRAAAQEERFSRRKHDGGFPVRAIRYCLDSAGLVFRDLEAVTLHGSAGHQAAEAILQSLAPDVEWRDRLVRVPAHLGHAASAFLPSPYDQAAVLVLGGPGDAVSVAAGTGRGKDLTVREIQRFPHSLGLLYSAFTAYAGFKVHSGEYKLMGLAPYGEPRYRDRIRQTLIDLRADGTFRLDTGTFGDGADWTAVTERLAAVFGRPARRPDIDPLEPFHKDVAASIQAVTEEVVLRLTRALAAEYGIPNLCLAGDVALNCVVNGKVLRDGAFRNLWVQPASGDAGGALGAALWTYHLVHGRPRTVGGCTDAMQGAFLGPAFAQAEIERRLAAAGARYTVLPWDTVLDAAVEALTEGKAVGWMQGRMEFGPRALGARSILGDPRDPAMQQTLNRKVKFRESFRPFAPSVLREDAAAWFALDRDSPYMLLVADVTRQRGSLPTAEGTSGGVAAEEKASQSAVPAVTHVDGSARVQTVRADTHPRFHALLRRFKETTGCPILVNTSFNVRGEPIVCTPEDAFRCFMGSDIEMLVAGNCLLRKEDQDPALKQHYADKFEPD